MSGDEVTRVEGAVGVTRPVDPPVIPIADFLQNSLIKLSKISIESSGFRHEGP